MLIKPIKILLLILLINLLPVSTALADSRLGFGKIGNSALIDINPANSLFSIKKGQPYDEAKDMPFRTFNGGPTDESPQHGYFAVPLVVIGIAGIFIFFMKND